MLLIKSNNCSNVFAIIYRRCVTHLKNELIQIFNYISNVIIIILISISVQLRRPVLLSRIRCRYISEEYTNKIYGTHRYTPLWLVKWILPLVQDPGDCNSNNKHVFITNYNYLVFCFWLLFLPPSVMSLISVKRKTELSYFWHEDATVSTILRFLYQASNYGNEVKKQVSPSWRMLHCAGKRLLKTGVPASL